MFATWMGEGNAPLLKSWNKNHWSLYIYICGPCTTQRGIESLLLSRLRGSQVLTQGN